MTENFKSEVNCLLYDFNLPIIISQNVKSYRNECFMVKCPNRYRQVKDTSEKQ